jgi:hypothetical protein
MAISSAIMSLAGVVTGAGIASGVAYMLAVRREKAERSNWRRDQCLTAYIEVLKTCATIHSEAMAAYMADANTEEQLLHAGLMTRATEELHGHVDKVLLLSPKEMYDDLSNLVTYFGELGTKSLQRPKIPANEWAEVHGSRYTRFYGAFTAAARNDLGIHAPHFTAKQMMKLNEAWELEKRKATSTHFCWNMSRGSRVEPFVLTTT